MKEYVEFKGRRFAFVPAALFGKDHSGLGVYIKYGRPKGFDKDCIEVKEETAWWKYILTPDRTLLIVKDGYKEEQIRPLDLDFDEFISWSQFHSTARDFDDTIYMVNYVQHLEKKDYDFNMATNMPLKNGSRDWRYISDSGGFQILTDKADFLSPTDVAEWYHKNVDLGIALDIPTGVNDQSLLDRAAKVQKMNNLEMLEVIQRLDSPLEIVNVSHGFTLEQQLKYIAEVEIEQSKRIALSDVYRTSILEAIDLISRVIYKIKDRYDHFHILGVYNLTILPALILMANKYPIKHMTTDASTHLQSGINKMYHHQSLPETAMRRIPIGKKNGEATRAVSSSHKVLPCSCPVCSSLKYFDIFSMLDGSTLSFTLAQHNLFEISRYTKFMNSMARDLSPQDYIKLVESQLKGRGNIKETIHALHYIYEAAEAGNPDKVRKKYSSYFTSNGLFKDTVASTLFGEDEVIEEYDPKDKATRIDKVLTMYEDHHAKERKSTVLKKKGKEKTGRSVTAIFSKKKKVSSKGLKAENQRKRAKIKKAKKAI